VSSAGPLHRKEKPSADSTAERQPGPKLNKADNAAQKLKPFTAEKPAKREQNVLKVCVGFVS